MTLNSLICHHLCSAAATHTLLLEQKVVAARLGWIYRYSIAALIAATLLWFELPDVRLSHYATVGLPIDASHYEILAQHSRIKLHFQKNGPPDDIAQIKRAFEVLVNEDKRRIYNRFGDLESELIGDANLPVVATSLAFAYHILSCIMSMALHRSNAISLTRYIMFMYSAIAFALEIESRFVYDSSLFKSVIYLNQLLPFQRVMLFRGIAPALGLILNLICVNYYTDTEDLNVHLWESAVSTNKVIMEKMTNVIEATNFVKSRISSSSLSSSAYLKVASSANDHQKPSEATTASSAETLKEIVESMDEGQRQKVMALIKSVGAGTDTDKSEGWMNTLKGPVIYMSLFAIVKYFTS